MFEAKEKEQTAIVFTFPVDLVFYCYLLLQRDTHVLKDC